MTQAPAQADRTAGTAISRTKPSAPMAWLKQNKHLKGKVLDYGCGRGFDAKKYKLAGWDPNYANWEIKDKYDTITCIYVLNVVSPEEQAQVIDRVWDHLAWGGIAYFAVRRDLKKPEVKTRWTTQRDVRLDLPAELVLERKGSFAIYALRKPAAAFRP